MTLKDEIDRLIRAERSKLEHKELATKNYSEKQELRFQPMHATLEEIVKSIPPDYLESELGEHDARIRIGLREATSGSFKETISWHIEPNFRLGRTDEPSEGFVVEEPGFRLEESITIEFPEYDLIENTYTFKTEAEVAQYVVPIIVKQVAHHEHLNERLKRLSGRNPIPMSGPEET